MTPVRAVPKSCVSLLRRPTALTRPRRRVTGTCGTIDARFQESPGKKRLKFAQSAAANLDDPKVDDFHTAKCADAAAAQIQKANESLTNSNSA
jgi:hypothetical protein